VDVLVVGDLVVGDLVVGADHGRSGP